MVSPQAQAAPAGIGVATGPAPAAPRIAAIEESSQARAASTPAATPLGQITPPPLASHPSLAASSMKTTAQKIEEFYGVKQVGDEVIFAVKLEHARKVLVAGDFNNWMPMSTPMHTNGRPGLWMAKLPLPPGRYRYRLVVDGKWVTDPNNKYVEANEYGELNNIVEVAA
jgi:hypothetical protein